MKIGYIPVSKQEQNEALQRDALQEAECEKYFSDKMTGSTFERKGLEKALAFVRPGDTFVETSPRPAGSSGLLMIREHVRLERSC